MIRALVNLAEHRRNSANNTLLIHDALKEEDVSIDCVIDAGGHFVDFRFFEKVKTLAEALTAKKGKARLLLDKAEEVLGICGKNKEGGTNIEGSISKKHTLFIEKLNMYNLPCLEPVRKFYGSELELTKARERFLSDIPEKLRIGHIAFFVQGADRRLHEESEVYTAIIKQYELLHSQNKGGKFCSVCGQSSYPVEDIPHGMIKKVPDGQSSGCALVSYNNSAFESYSLKGNNNSSICTHCGKAYVEALNWLLSNGYEQSQAKGKPRFVYSNRKKISSDTTFLFWTKNSDSDDGFVSLLDSGNDDDIRKFIESTHTGKKSSDYLDTDRFYGLSISGSAARVVVRDWIEMAIPDCVDAIKAWFHDISIVRGQTKEEPARVVYPTLWMLVSTCKRKEDKKDQLSGRIGSVLWGAALRNKEIPLWVLSSILNRVRAEQGKMTCERVALIKLYLNRTLKIKGEILFMAELDETNKSIAYLCGRLFATLERLQYHAQGNVNAGIGERFFTAASSTPSPAFGRLMKLAKQHLSKLKGDKPGLAVNIDKEIQLLCKDINEFPNIFRLEEQGAFALGYYHQKNRSFNLEHNN